MGLPLPEPEYGNDCLACWPPGETPKFVLMMITGAVGCPFGPPPFDPANSAWILPQTNPCEWLLSVGVYGLSIERDYPGGFTLFTQVNTGRRTFYSAPADPCASGGDNMQICTYPFFTGTDGSCFVDFLPWPATPRMLCDDYGLLPSEDTFTDPYIIETEPPTTVVFTLANIKYSTKLRIRYDYTV